MIELCDIYDIQLVIIIHDDGYYYRDNSKLPHIAQNTEVSVRYLLTIIVI